MGHVTLSDFANYLWLGVGAVWLFGAIVAKRTEQTQSLGSRLRQVSLEFIAFFLLFSSVGPRWLPWRFVAPESSVAQRIGLALTALGIAFAVWARLWLGRNWSGRVTIKEQHELIQDGPYTIVRHPIYSGLLLAMLGTAIVRGEVCGLIALPFAILGWTFKLRTEESFMTQQFGAAYLDYKRRVKALVPFVV
jgi:protein-S-isoprenylcysteine O-methyltransferase Ste14